MAKILIVYSTTDGHTIEICHRLEGIIEQQAHHVSLFSVSDSTGLDLQAFDKIIIGASIRYGKHSPQVVEFINENKELLDSKPNAFFSVNVVARKPDKNQPEPTPTCRSSSSRYPGDRNSWPSLPARSIIQVTGFLIG